MAAHIVASQPYAQQSSSGEFNFSFGQNGSTLGHFIVLVAPGLAQRHCFNPYSIGL